MYFDLHCDTIPVLREKGENLWENQRHVSLQKGRGLKHWLQTFAIFLPDSLRGEAAVSFYEENARFFQEQLKQYAGKVQQVTRGEEIDRAFAEEKCAALLSVEGGSVLAGDLSRIPKLYADGVRLLTLTWNGENEIASGNATDKGLSRWGRKAVKALEKQGILLDVSHLNDRGFAELCEIAEKPFVATHSNSRAVCQHPRNLTDEQFREIVRRGGLVGMNFFRDFLSNRPEQAGMEDLLRHVVHFLELGGEDVLCMGSDFDGAAVPEEMGSVEKMEDIRVFLQNSQIAEKVVEKIMGRNAYLFLQKNLV